MSNRSINVSDGYGLDNDASGQAFKMICKTLKNLTALYYEKVV